MAGEVIRARKRVSQVRGRHRTVCTRRVRVGEAPRASRTGREREKKRAYGRRVRAGREREREREREGRELRA